MVIPDDFVIELLEATRSGHADYEMLEQAMDRAISKIILSQTMTTDDGSSRSQAEVHQEVKIDVIKSDADLLCASFNEQVVKRLIEWNFPNANPPQVWRRTEPEEDLVQLAERDNKIMMLGYEPTEEYIQETYGMGWRKKKEVTPPQGSGVPPLNADFADVSQLTLDRIKHRKDQQELVDAAEYLGSQYKDLYGKKIENLIAFMEDTNDVETFKKHLTELINEPVSDSPVEFVERASFFGRLMGIFKGQQRAS